MALSLWAFCAHADLYRWVDPETGSVKFSSYPPPWYGEESAPKRAPRVEHIPPRKASDGARVGPAPDAPREAAGGSTAASLEQERKALVRQIGGAADRGALGRPDMQKQIEALASLTERLDKLDPQGAAERRRETEALLQGILSGNARPAESK